MSEPKWAAVCESEMASDVVGTDYCIPTKQVQHSPIDDYYTYVGDVLRFGKKDDLDSSDTLGRLLLLGLVTGVELYLRSILSGAVRVCPICRTQCSDHPVAYGSVEFYGADEYEWALFDSSSLAGSEEVRTKTKKLLGIEIPRNTSIDAALVEYGKLCHLRHAAVHTRGVITRGNASSLAIGGGGSRMSVRIDLPGLHSAGSVCHSFVRAYNRFLYRRIVERWIAQSLLIGEWASDKAGFTALFNLFYSRADGVASPNAYQAYRKLAPTLAEVAIRRALST